MIINLDIISWQFSIIILLLILFFIYVFFGGGEYEYIGLSPLEIGFDASRHVEHSNSDNSEIIDNTPNLPDLSHVPLLPKKEIKVKNRFCSSGSYSSEKYSEPSYGHLVESMSESYDSYMESEEFQIPQTPRTAALGPYKFHKNGFISKGEKLCKQAIEDIYGKPFYCVRPDFLKNPESGRNLEIDLYNDELRIGVEYQGIGHYQFPNPFHKTHEDFMNQIRRDQFKVDMCDLNNIYLISVPYNVSLSLEAIKKYITYYLPENVKLRSKK